MILFDESAPPLDPLDLARCPGCGAPTVARLGWIHVNSGAPIVNTTDLMEVLLGDAEAPMVCATCNLTLDVVLEPRVPFFENAGADPEARRDRYLDHLYRDESTPECGGPPTCPWCAKESKP